MGSSLYTSDNPVVVSTGANFDGKTGYLAKASAGAAALNDSTTAPALAVILNGEVAAKNSSLGMLGAISGKVRLKVSGNVAKYAELQQAADGTVATDAGSGNRVIVGRALEAGVAGDLIEAITFTPQIRA